MEETTININIELKNSTLHKADTMMKKLLKGCDIAELDNIKNARISKTISEIEMSSDIFEEISKDEKGL